jgi:hypothetical protein
VSGGADPTAAPPTVPGDAPAAPAPWPDRPEVTAGSLFRRLAEIFE